MTNTQKYLEQASEIFDSFEKWNAFLELTKIKGEIVYKWYSDLENSVLKGVNIIENIEEWKFKRYNPQSYGWYLKSYGEGSLTILFEDNKYCLYTDWGKYNVVGIFQKYRRSKLFSFFDEPELKENNHYFAVKINAISLDGITDLELLSYYLCNKRKEHELLSKNVSNFFVGFMKDREMIKIIEDINTNYKLS